MFNYHQLADGAANGHLDSITPPNTPPDLGSGRRIAISKLEAD